MLLSFNHVDLSPRVRGSTQVGPTISAIWVQARAGEPQHSRHEACSQASLKKPTNCFAAFSRSRRPDSLFLCLGSDYYLTYWTILDLRISREGYTTIVRKDRQTQALLSHTPLELARRLIGEIVKPTASGSLCLEGFTRLARGGDTAGRREDYHLRLHWSYNILLPPSSQLCSSQRTTPGPAVLIVCLGLRISRVIGRI